MFHISFFKFNFTRWIYVSNSEVENGGVGAITFDINGEVINYDMLLRGTHLNCGGGKTYWNTWVSCEENELSGQVFEVDPFVDQQFQRNKSTVLGGSGGNYESFAYDARDRFQPTFYVTNDRAKGSLVRFTPDESVVNAAEQTGDYSNMLHVMGTLEYLVLSPKSNGVKDMNGTFKWIPSRAIADINAKQFYKNAEGIDIRNGFLYFTTKKSKSLFILDLDNFTYERSSTVNGSFDGQPDQVARIIKDNDTSGDMLYFCEEASSSNGIHARDANGIFHTVLTSKLKSETSG